MIGQILGHYRILERLGQGGMGVVYKALDTKLNRHVAIKVLPQELTADPERRLRFQREAQTAAALNHPNIATIHEVGEHQGSQYLVMEFVEGRTLRELIGHHPLPLKEWLRVALPIAEGLSHAHARHVIHRDLKPDNVMITGEHQVKILDFGLAKLLEPEATATGTVSDVHSSVETISHELSRAGKVFGTVAYMAPEQARGERADHRSDLFSLGIVLYQMATGRLPFKGRSDVETLHSIIADEPPPVSQLVRVFPPEAERMVRKTMEKERERRYQDAADLAADLRNLQRDVDSGRVSIRGLTHEEVKLPLVDRAIGVMGFENLSDTKDSESLGRMLTGLITTDLSESGGLKVISTAKVLASLRQVGQPGAGGFSTSVALEAAGVAGAQLMLVGQVGQVGDCLFVIAELVNVDSGDTLKSLKKEAVSKSELFTLAGAIASEVRKRVGAEAPKVKGKPAERPASHPFDLVRALTGSTEAYRQYAAGELALNQGRFPEAIDRFGHAIQEDPTFALAYYRLAMAHEWNGNHAEALGTYRRGFPYIERLPARWQTVYQAGYDYQRGNHDACYVALTELTRSSADIADAYYILGEVATHCSRYEDHKKTREFFEKALEIDPTFEVIFFHLIPDYIAADDLEKATRLLAAYHPADPAVTEAEITILTAQEKYEEAAARGEELMRRGYTSAWRPLSYSYLEAGKWDRAYSLVDDAVRKEVGFPRAVALLYRGLAQVGRGLFQMSIDDFRVAATGEHATVLDRGFSSHASGIHVIRAQVFAAAGKTSEAVGALREAIQVDPHLHRAYFWLGRILLGLGRGEESEQLLRDFQAAARETFTPSGTFWLHLFRAERHLADQNLSGAGAELNQLSAFAPEHRDRRAEWMIRAKVSAAEGDTSGAILAYRELLHPRYQYILWYPDVVTKTLALYALGCLEEKAGDDESARQHYREFLDRWGNADMSIAEVEDAKARLTALDSS